MRVGYGKIGRVIEIDPKKWGEAGGDNEPPFLLLSLARKHPDITWVMLANNSGWAPPLPNIENPWLQWKEALKIPKGATKQEIVALHDRVTMPLYGTLDGIIMWIGQHGTTNAPLPKTEDRALTTSAQDSFVRYASHQLRGINYWRKDDPVAREEIYLLPDVRNYIKFRDTKWPRLHPVLAQFSFAKTQWCERYGDPRTPEETGFTKAVEFVEDGKWKAKDHYVASGLELVGVQDRKADLPGWADRENFGMVINENRNYGMRPELTRLYAMQKYVMPLDPSWIHGAWQEKSLAQLGMDIQPLPYHQIFDKMVHTKSTLTTPASGSGWATAKPWESFSTGTICFFHPSYDTQGNIIPRLDEVGDILDDDLKALTRWLRIGTPEDLKKRVDAVSNDQGTYEWLRDMQYKLFDAAMEDQRCITMIEKRLGL